MKKIAIIMAAGVLLASCGGQNAGEVNIEKVVANTVVGDMGMMIKSFDIYVDNAKAIKKLKAEDFDLTSNGYSGYCDPETRQAPAAYTDDGITVTVRKNVLHLEAKPFSINGMRGADWRPTPWELHCTNPALNITAENITEKTTSVIDDCIRGEFTFAGITREYMLWLPKDSKGNVIKNSPLLVWQIGGGEYNMPLEPAALANRCLTSLPEHGEKCATLMFAIANPNYSYSASLDPEKIKLVDRNNALQMAFIDTLIEDGTIDGSKVFCAGASSGGGCTMRFTMQFPDRFKAAVPICSMDPIVPIHMVQEAYDGQFTDDIEKAFQGQVYKWDGNDMTLADIDTQAFVKLPLFFVHAENDRTCKVISSHAYFDARKRLGAADDHLLIFDEEQMNEFGMGGPALSHFSWVRMLNDYSEGSAMDWLIKQF